MSEDAMMYGAYDRAQHELTSPDLRMGDTQRQRLLMPPAPRVALTGYRLLVTSVIVGIGVPKAVYSYYGQSLVSPTLDWLGGIVFGLLLYWLGVIEATSPESCPCFFQVDLVSATLRFLRRDRTRSLSLPTSVPQPRGLPISLIPATYSASSTDSLDSGSSYRDSVTSQTTALSPPDAGRPTSPKDARTVHRAGRKEWDPDYGIEMFQKQSEEVLARFLKMGSWEEQSQSQSPG